MASNFDELNHAVRVYAKKHEVQDMGHAKDIVIAIVKKIRDELEKEHELFEVSRIDFTGSAFQKVKIDKPDEFDFDFPLEKLKVDDIDPTYSCSSIGKHFIRLLHLKL